MGDLAVVLIVVLILVVIWRGPKTIPQIGRVLGQGVREARIEANKIRSSSDDKAAGAADSTADGGTSTSG